MKHLLYLILSFISVAVVHAQDDAKVYRWSIGISAGDVLHNLFNDEAPNKAYAAFLLEYAGQRYSLQAGFRPGYNLANHTHEGFLDSEVDKQTSLSGHLALFRTVLSDKNWLLKAGVRYEGGWSREDIIKDSGFDRVTTRRLEWNGGLGPVLDIRYFVHPRISIGTDAALVYSYSESQHQQLFTNFPDFDTTLSKVTERKLKVVEPMTMYIRFHL